MKIWSTSALVGTNKRLAATSKRKWIKLPSSPIHKNRLRKKLLTHQNSSKPLLTFRTIDSPAMSNNLSVLIASIRQKSINKRLSTTYPFQSNTLVAKSMGYTSNLPWKQWMLRCILRIMIHSRPHWSWVQRSDDFPTLTWRVICNPPAKSYHKFSTFECQSLASSSSHHRFKMAHMKASKDSTTTKLTWTANAVRSRSRTSAPAATKTKTLIHSVRSHRVQSSTADGGDVRDPMPHLRSSATMVRIYQKEISIKCPLTRQQRSK